MRGCYCVLNSVMLIESVHLLQHVPGEDQAPETVIWLMDFLPH